MNNGYVVALILDECVIIGNIFALVLVLVLISMCVIQNPQHGCNGSRWRNGFVCRKVLCALNKVIRSKLKKKMDVFISRLCFSVGILNKKRGQVL